MDFPCAPFGVLVFDPCSPRAQSVGPSEVLALRKRFLRFLEEFVSVVVITWWGSWGLYMLTILIYISGQIIIFHQPRFPWNKGISLLQLPFGVRSCEVAIIWPDISCGDHTGSIGMKHCGLWMRMPILKQEMSNVLPFRAFNRDREPQEKHE